MHVFEVEVSVEDNTLSATPTDRKLYLKETEPGVFNVFPPELMLGYGNAESDSVSWTGFGMVNFRYEHVPEVVEIPEDVEMKSYSVFHSSDTQPLDADFLKVGRKGTDVYISGFRGVSQGCVKGTLNIMNQTLTIPGNQVMSMDLNTLLFVRFYTVRFENMEINGLMGTKHIPEIELKWNLVKNTYEAKNDSTGFFYWNRGVNYYQNPMMQPQENPSDEVFTPMKPEIVSVSDWDGLNKFRQIVCIIPPRNDEQTKALEKQHISWCVYLNNENTLCTFMPEFTNLENPVTEIPYGFNSGTMDFMFSYGTLHYFFLREENINRFGIQSIYRINDEEKKSEICWLELTNSVNETEIEELPACTELFDLSGKRVAEGYKGIRIRRIIYPTGKIKVKKEVLN